MNWFADRMKKALEKEQEEALADGASKLAARTERIEKYERSVAMLAFVVRFALITFIAWAAGQIGLFYLDHGKTPWLTGALCIALYAFGRTGARRP